MQGAEFFNIKFLNQILATNTFLKMCKVKNSAICTCSHFFFFFGKTGKKVYGQFILGAVQLLEHSTTIFALACGRILICQCKFLNCDSIILGIINTAQKP